MDANDKLKALDFRGRDFPLIRGDVKFKLKNVHNGKTEVQEHHNIVTNALADIFGNNYGGLLNYQNFADLFKTYMGGVLLFRDPLDDTDATSYGIPALTSNPVVAHAGQTPMTSQRDDTTRGDPDDYGTLVQENSTKLTFEWGTSAGNAPLISSLGLTHTDVGSFGCGVNSDAQKQLDPFISVSSNTKTYAYADNGAAVLAVNGNVAYNVYMTSGTSVNVYRTPLNNNRFKLQGAALEPLTDYSERFTATLTADYNPAGQGGFYYHFDFTANTLTLFGVPTLGGNVIYKDVIDLSNWNDQTATHAELTLPAEVKLWNFRAQDEGNVTGFGVGAPLSVPTRAIVYNGYLFAYALTGLGNYEMHPSKIYKVNLNNAADYQEINTANVERFDGQGFCETAERFAQLGGIIVHDSFLINGDTCYQTNRKASPALANNVNYANTSGVSAPVFGINGAFNNISVCKLYLATKFNLPQPVQKTASQSMTVEYTLTEV